MSDRSFSTSSGLALALGLGLAVACGGGRPASDGGATPAIDGAGSGAGLAPALPAAVSAETTRFMTADRCAMCHNTSGAAMRDSAGRDVAQLPLWRSSMMAMSARDPYWLAVLAEERAEHPQPAAAAFIDELCTRCHAPGGARERAAAGAAFGLADVLTSDSVEAALGRDGVTCSVCHQITPDGLGQPASFNAGFTIGDTRAIFGPHANPFAMPMLRHTGYTPTQADHMASAELCATCHTVVTRALDDVGAPTGPEVVEQAPYLEWRNSEFATGGPRAATCVGCHAPTIDLDGAAIATQISSMPPWLEPRQPVARHVFTGANATMLRVFAAAADWTGSAVVADEFEAAAALAETTLRGGLQLAITEVARQGERVAFTVALRNLAGHKFPTGYPNRRLWLHVRVLDAGGATLFESGRTDAAGRLVDPAGRVLESAERILPHLDRLTSADQVAAWEAVLVDGSGRPQHLVLDAVGYGKDNRLLPVGWTADHPDAARTGSVGVSADPDFVAGGDVVHVDVVAPGAARVEVVARFQSVTGSTVERFVRGATPMAARFVELVGRAPRAGSTVATATAVVP
ncbi:MAG: hypothetical protein KA297_06875 [Kofleriaceae bacterium]|nr:hypothetical protein [Kofleriaceae bacterium]MBP6836908.1 hypothetical protein [Kofleriaceae bacterium]